jgi:CRP/FNR family transcriptional regulator
MTDSVHVERLFELFPGLGAMSTKDLAAFRAQLRFPSLDAGAVAYRQGWECQNYLMCIEGGTRAFKSSSSGREILIYRVKPGATCAFTTQCLLAGGTFPAESVAEAPTRMAALPASAFHELLALSVPFRRFVLDDYGQLLASMIDLVDEVAFASLDQRLARRLLAEADRGGMVAKTHQQLALDLGSVREVISRTLSEWERQGWVKTNRGKIEILDRSALASYRCANS